MQKPNLQKLLLKWQARLRLLDWDITAEYTPSKEMDGIGHNDYDSKYHWAHIRIIDPRENTSDPRRLDLFNTELTLIHELLHLIISPLGTDHIHKDEELAVEIIAKGLLNI